MQIDAPRPLEILIQPSAPSALGIQNELLVLQIRLAAEFQRERGAVTVPHQSITNLLHRHIRHKRSSRTYSQCVVSGTHCAVYSEFVIAQNAKRPLP
jgi:hypothetical protein